jgi:hypothetical protein
MRMPLVRRGDDETPIAWWEWLFAPLLMPLFMVYLLLVMPLVFVPVGFVCGLWQRRQEKRLRAGLAAAGRFVEWAEVEEKLRAGVGTLIIEHRSPGGPIREWWVPADLIADAPVPLPASVRSIPADEGLEPLQRYARICASRYLDVESGSAKLTEVPVPISQRLDPRKYVVVDLGGGLMTAVMLATDRKLAEHYPAAKVVTLIAWYDEPVLAVGDIEAVFLPPPDPASQAGRDPEDSPAQNGEPT